MAPARRAEGMAAASRLDGRTRPFPPPGENGRSRRDASAVTREHKLALLVGFGLVLVVGILISDHFSKARTAQLSDVSAAGAENFGALTLSEPDALASPIPADPLAAMPPAQAMYGPGLVEEPSARPEPAAVEIVMGGEIGERPVLGGSDLGGSVIGYGERVGASLGLLGNQLPYAAETTVPAVVEPEPQRADVAAAVQRETAAVTPASGRSGASVLPVSNGPLLSHEVAKGENLTKISQKYYGDGSLWRQLQSYNTGRVAADGMVRQGTTLLIPPKDVLIGRARLAADAKAVPAGSATRPQQKPVDKPAAEKQSKPAPSKPAPRTYTVKPGDTLGAIAQRHLGTSRRWQEILDLNRSKLDDADSIRVGMVLMLPAE